MDSKSDWDWLREALARAELRLTDIEKTLSAQHVTLVEHTRRSEANEASVEKLKQEISPLKTHVALFGALAKVVAFLGVVTSLVIGVAHLLQMTGH